MVSEDLKQAAGTAWSEYGERIKAVWQLAPKGRVVAKGLAQMLSTATEERVRAFIQWVEQQTRALKTMI